MFVDDCLQCENISNNNVALIYSKGDFCLVLQTVFSSYSPVAYLDFAEGGSEV